MKNNKLSAFALAALVALGFAAIFAGSVTPASAEAIAYMAGMAII